MYWINSCPACKYLSSKVVFCIASGFDINESIFQMFFQEIKFNLIKILLLFYYAYSGKQVRPQIPVMYRIQPAHAGLEVSFLLKEPTCFSLWLLLSDWEKSFTQTAWIADPVLSHAYGGHAPPKWYCERWENTWNVVDNAVVLQKLRSVIFPFCGQF